MSKSKSTGNGQTTLLNRDHTELDFAGNDFAGNKESMCCFLQSGKGAVKIHSVKDLEGILARPGCKPVSLAEMDVSIVFGALGRGKS